MTAVYLDLAAYACATTFSPGPNNILLLSSTSRFGFRKCLPLIFGIWGGLVTIMLLCGFCCAWLGELVPQIVPIAKYVGAAYILMARGLATTGPVAANLVCMTEPVLNPVWVALFWGETVGPMSLLGIAVVLAGLLFYNLAGAKKREEAPGVK